MHDLSDLYGGGLRVVCRDYHGRPFWVVEPRINANWHVWCPNWQDAMNYANRYVELER